MKLKMPSTRGWIFAIVTGLLSIGTAYYVSWKSPHGWWDSIPAYWAIFGFVGCWVIVIGSKWLGKMFLSKDEDWYG